MEGVSENYSDIECLNLSDHWLKIACYNHNLEYMKHIVTTNQKSVRGIQEIKRKKSTVEKHCGKSSIYQRRE